MTTAPLPSQDTEQALRSADANGSNHSSKDKGSRTEAEAPALLSKVTRDGEWGNTPANSSGEEDNQATTPSVRSASMDGRAKSANYKQPSAESVDEDEEDSQEPPLPSTEGLKQSMGSLGSSLGDVAHSYQLRNRPGEALSDATLGAVDPAEHTSSDSNSSKRPMAELLQAKQLPEAPSGARTTCSSRSGTVKTTGSGNRVGITGTYPANIQNSFKSVTTKGSDNWVGVLPKKSR